MRPVVTADQMRAIEAAAFARGVSKEELTDRAADAITRHLLRPPFDAGSVLVLAGPGNNGLDAVKVYARLTALGRQARLYCLKRTDCEGVLRLEGLAAALNEAAVVLDGLFGIGLSRDLEGEAVSVIEAVERERARRQGAASQHNVVAVDIPSGLNADSGSIMGRALRADMTVTLGLPKLGLFSGSGPSLAGRIVQEGIGLDQERLQQAGTTGFDSTLNVELPRRAVGSHKNDNGRVLVIGGSLRYPLAPVMVALAAHRAGAGYVTVGFPRSLLGPVAAHLLEQTLLPLAEAELGAIGPFALEEAREQASSYKALVIGNGLDREPETQSFVLQLLGAPASNQKRSVGFRTGGEATTGAQGHSLPPVMVDGDGLYALASQDAWHESAEAVALLTPHPGEMARLLDISTEEVEADRIGVARKAASTWRKTVLLKGDYPVVASPDGAVQVLTESHPELGTAGTGDVLAGLCGWALALGMEPPLAAQAALVLGARAARIATERVGADCVGAGDLIRALPDARRAG